MLILSRKKEQSIIINDDIEIVVLDVQKDVIKLGIKAPKNVSVYRKELYEEIREENQKASSINVASLPKIGRDG